MKTFLKLAKERSFVMDLPRLKRELTIKERNRIYKTAKKSFLKDLKEGKNIYGICIYLRWALKKHLNMWTGLDKMIDHMPEINKYRKTTSLWWPKTNTDVREECLTEAIELTTDFSVFQCCYYFYKWKLFNPKKYRLFKQHYKNHHMHEAIRLTYFNKPAYDTSN